MEEKTPSRVVRPETEKLSLSNGDWILVRKRLSVGERHDSYEHMYLRNADGSFVLSNDGRLVVGAANSRIASILSYLIDWSFTDQPIFGEPMDVIKSCLRAIDEDSFDEIAVAIEAHEAALAKERAEKKNTVREAHIRSDLSIAIRCGWTVDTVRALDVEDYDVLVEMLNEEEAARQKRADEPPGAGD